MLINTIFEKILSKYELDFMEFRLWIGTWTTVFLVLLVVFNLSYLVKYITRFTEDCFATLVAIVFIIDAIRNMMKISHTNEHTSNKSHVQLFDDHHANVNNDSLTFETSSRLTSIPSSYLTTSLSVVETTTTAIITSTFKTSTNDMLFKEHQKSVFYLSILLFLGTFFICVFLKEFRKKPYLPNKVNIHFFCLRKIFR